jgi:hypothetical protein
MLAAWPSGAAVAGQVSAARSNLHASLRPVLALTALRTSLHDGRAGHYGVRLQSRIKKRPL